jgi:hypothetical protein
MDVQLNLINAQIHYSISYSKYQSEPTFSRSLHIGAEDIAYSWLIPLKMVKRVRNAYFGLLEREQTEEGLKIGDRSKIRDFCGVMEEAKKCGCCV